MRFSVRGLDDVFTYPCTKADVRESFGDDLLESASFGQQADHHFARLDEANGIPGRVLLTLGVSKFASRLDEEPRRRASLYAYRVRREEWSEYLQWRMREILRDRLRPWVDAMMARPETAWGKHESTLIELREGALHIHERTSRRYL